MQLPQIRMESQLAQISIQQTQGKQEIRQPKANLSIEQPKAKISIQTVPSKLSIDQSQAWEDMNLMSIRRRTEKQAQEGYQGFLEGTERRARQGSELMKIENKGDPLVGQAIENGYDGMKSLGITFIPSPFSVKINYEPADVQIDVQTKQPLINATTQKAEHHYQPGTVEIQMKQYEQLEIDFINLFSQSV